MLKRVTLLAAFALVFVAGSAVAQPDPFCVMGVYADGEGTQSVYVPTQGQEFDIYVVMFAESIVNAAAFQLYIPDLNNQVFLTSETYGPGGGGINIPNSGGYNIGLGECAVGFSGFPIVISRHTLLMPFETIGPRSIIAGPNVLADVDSPLFSDCQGQLYPCNTNSTLLLESPIATEAVSFGAVKSLFGE